MIKQCLVHSSSKGDTMSLFVWWNLKPYFSMNRFDLVNVI